MGKFFLCKRQTFHFIQNNKISNGLYFGQKLENNKGIKSYKEKPLTKKFSVIFRIFFKYINCAWAYMDVGCEYIMYFVSGKTNQYCIF